MYGVVLWSDPEQGRAVIWCEDHGNLAFFSAPSDGTGLAGAVEPGDLVQFELCEAGAYRMARDLRLVAAEEYPTLAQDLRAAGPARCATAAGAGPGRSPKIVPFGVPAAGHSSARPARDRSAN